MKLLSHSRLDFLVEDDNGNRHKIHADPQQREILRELMEVFMPAEDDEEHNVHYLWHKFQREVPLGKGWDYIKAAEAFAEKPPEVIQADVDDGHFCSSSIFIFPHKTPHMRMGVTVLYIPQCTGEEPIQFFCYTKHLTNLITALTKAYEDITKVPEFDETSPMKLKERELTKKLLNTLKE